MFLHEAVGSKRSRSEDKKNFVFSVEMPDDWVEKPRVGKTTAALVQLGREDELFKKIASPFSVYPLDVNAILQVQNPMLYTAFEIQKHFYQDKTEMMLYHASHRDQILSKCSRGFDFEQGFFGRALYFADDIGKANMNTQADHETGLRCLFLCKVIVGQSKVFEVGHFDRALVEAPKGFQSVKGFVRNGFEYAVYNKSDAYVAYVVLYRIHPAEMGLRMSLIPPDVQGKPIVFITSALAEFFEKLQKRANDPEKLRSLNNLIRNLLKRQLTAHMFVIFVGQILQCGQAPAHLIPKIESELAKCNLPPKPYNF